MRQQSANKIAQYQCEAMQIQAQTQMLQNQLPSIQAQIINLQQYLTVNSGDVNARADFNQLTKQYNLTCQAIQKNNARFQMLQSKAASESNKIMVQQQKEMNKLYGRYYGM